MPFCHLLDIVIVTLCLHNLCIIHSDAFNMDWAIKAKMEMQIEANGKFRDFQNKKHVPHCMQCHKTNERIAKNYDN